MMFSGLENRFGIDRKIFEDYFFMINNKRKVFICNKLLSEFVGYGKFAALSLPFARMDGMVKPTTLMIQMFGKHASKGFIDLDRKQAIDYMEGLDVDVDSEDRGYVIIRYKEFNLGCGLLKEGSIKNQVPRAKRLSVDYL